MITIKPIGKPAVRFPEGTQIRVEKKEDHNVVRVLDGNGKDTMKVLDDEDHVAEGSSECNVFKQEDVSTCLKS